VCKNLLKWILLRFKNPRTKTSQEVWFPSHQQLVKRFSRQFSYSGTSLLSTMETLNSTSLQEVSMWSHVLFERRPRETCKPPKSLISSVTHMWMIGTIQVMMKLSYWRRCQLLSQCNCTARPRTMVFCTSSRIYSFHGISIVLRFHLRFFSILFSLISCRIL